MTAGINNGEFGLVSVIYYPGQRGLPIGHAELEVEGTCYTLAPDRGIASLAERIQKAARGNLPFIRTHIAVTPDELDDIQTNIGDGRIKGSSCMNGVSNVLNESANIFIPPLINMFPIASHFYLRCAKFLGNQKIGPIESYGNYFSNIGTFFAASIGVCVELGFIAAITFGAKSSFEVFTWPFGN